MSTNYYCRFCSLNYQIDKEVNKNDLVCSRCGDPLIKERILKPIQIIAALITAVFISPVVIMVIIFIEEVNRDLPLKNNDNQQKEIVTIN